MRTIVARVLLIGLLLGMLSGCATTAARTDLMNTGLPDAEHPEYLAHPFRLIALPLHAVGNLLQYAVIEPLYFGLATMPDVVGLSPEEQRYLAERQAAWAGRRGVEPGAVQ
jgi:hypothetical protein